MRYLTLAEVFRLHATVSDGTSGRSVVPSAESTSAYEHDFERGAAGVRRGQTSREAHTGRVRESNCLRAERAEARTTGISRHRVRAVLP